MQSVRQRRSLARLVLAWFLLWLGVAVLSPAVAGSGLQVVCSGGTMKLAAGSEGAASELPAHVMQCPACTPAMGAPPVALVFELHAIGKAVPPASLLSSAFAQALLTPGSARGPPILS